MTASQRSTDTDTDTDTDADNDCYRNTYESSVGIMDIISLQSLRLIKLATS